MKEKEQSQLIHLASDLKSHVIGQDDAVDKMAQKGARESLIYMNDMAFVVSVANRTVITAMDGKSARENIFTNIDSAAILS